MINTGPMGKSAAGMAGQDTMGAQPMAQAPLTVRGGANMRPQPNRMAPQRPPMTPHGMAGMAVNKLKGMFGGGNKPAPRSPIAASGAGIGPSPFQNMGYKAGNATGATGNPMSQFGGANPGGPVSGGPDMATGPVAQSAPPMYEPPPMGDGGAMAQVDPMMMENLKRRMGGNSGFNGGNMGGGFMTGMY